MTRNVADLADPPKVRVGSGKAMSVWSAEELRAFLASVEDHDLYAALYLAANTGMRRGEVLGLSLRNVDLDAGRLEVNQAVLAVGYATSVADVKTIHSRRTVDLDERTVAVLRAWRRRQLEELLATGCRVDDYVFARADGRPIHPDFFAQTWEPACGQTVPAQPPSRLAPHPRLDPAQGRRAGKVVSERLGHSSPAFTMTVYQHVLPGMQADAAATFSNAVFGGSGSGAHGHR